MNRTQSLEQNAYFIARESGSKMNLSPDNVNGIRGNSGPTGPSTHMDDFPTNRALGPFSGYPEHRSVYSVVGRLMIWHLFLACVAILVCVGSLVKRLRRWFLTFGCFGVLVALTLAAISSRQVVNPKILIVLWPASLYGFANPSTLSHEILIATLEFGGNFMLYGAVGTVVGLASPEEGRIDLRLRRPDIQLRLPSSTCRCESNIHRQRARLPIIKIAVISFLLSTPSFVP